MTTGPAGRALRKDVVRNRARLLEAARAVFAERGLAATVDDIAQRAGVGTATAYRHFENKREIAAEILADASEQIVRDADAALAVADPWAGLVMFFERTAARQAADRGLYETLAGHGGVDDKDRIWPRIVDSVTRLVTRAQDAGAVRGDVGAEDVAPVFAMLGATYGMAAPERSEPWRRYLALLLDGLRAPGQTPLPGGPPVLRTFDDMTAIGKHPGRPTA